MKEGFFMITFRQYQAQDLVKLREIWNDVVADGIAFPGENQLNENEFQLFLNEQSAVNCLFYDEQLAGFYILHPNNIGRCSHVANASYCLDKQFRGKNLANELVKTSLIQAKQLNFTGMQYNAVVVTNHAAIKVYQKNGLAIIGTITKGFRLKDDSYSDMYIMYKEL